MTFRWLLLAALLSLFLGAYAACGPECPEGQTKCGEGDTAACLDLKVDRANCGACGTACEDGQACNAGTCELTCQDGLVVCSNTCTDTKTDGNNCGACGTKCADGEVCTDGTCTPTCSDGLTACNGECIDTQTNPANCGACGTKCDGGKVCKSGKCELECQSSQTECNGACVDTQSDVNNCGSCGTKCDSGTVCSEGSCKVSCQKDLTNCSGSCINTKVDNANCGACGTACNAGEICKDSKCELNCATDYENCSGTCINTKTSRENCGGCGTKCADGEVCVAGKCEVSCQKDLTSCSNKCVNTDTDNANCGGCGTACKTGEVCQSGKCEYYCQPGYTNCSSSCVNTNGDNANCGTCGNACPSGESCNAGKCEKTATACSAGESACGSACVAFQTDVKNCGGCGIACKAGDVCLRGRCLDCPDCPNFAKSFGAFNSDYLRDLTVDKDGNVIAIGYYTSGITLIGDNKLTTKGGSTSNEIWIAKFNPNGNVLWAKSAGSSSTDYGYGITVDSQGNIYATGAYSTGADFGSVQLASKGGYDIFVSKLDKDGKWLWTKGYGSTSSDYGYDIKVDSKDNVYVTGYFYNSMVMDSTTLSSKGSADIFLAKLDGTGKVLWAGSAGSTSSDYGYGIATDSKDNVYLTGYFYNTMSWGTTTLSSAGSADLFVAKFDSTGSLVYATSAGGTSTEYAYGIAVDKTTGNAYVTGYTSSTGGATFGTTSVTTNGSGDIYVAKLDDKGVWVWSMNMGNSSSDYGYRVAVDSKGYVYATGYFYTSIKLGDADLSSAGSNDIFLAQIDEKTGKAVGGTVMGGSSSDYGYGLFIDANDNIYLGGYGYNNWTLGQVNLVHRAGLDFFIAKYPPRTAANLFCPSKGYSSCNGVCTNTGTSTTNCGACGTLCMAGQLCAAGKCLTPKARLYLEEVNTGGPDYVKITNRTANDVDLSTIWIYANWSDTTFANSIFNEALPKFTLKAGSSVYCVENLSTATATEIACPNMPYVSSDDFTIMLCQGACTATSGTNVIDFLQAGTPKRFFPPGVTFTPDGVTNPPSDSSSYFQLPLLGTPPAFFQADWYIAPKSK